MVRLSVVANLHSSSSYVLTYTWDVNLIGQYSVSVLFSEQCNLAKVYLLYACNSEYA